MARNLLLISNSTLHGSGYLDHCETQIREVLGDRKNVLFVPYARPSGKTHEEYTAIAHERFAKMGFNLRGIHHVCPLGGPRVYEDDDPKVKESLTKAINSADAIFIGGGNTFVLQNALCRKGIVDSIRHVVSNGMPYIGTSAGANVAGRTVMNTNDMPITHPPTFSALNLVPFNINPHYQDKPEISEDTQRRLNALAEIDPALATALKTMVNQYLHHQGETRETRIKEYHVFNDDTVVGLREGAMLHVVGDKVTLKGSTGARIFRNGQEPTEHQPGESLDFLLN